MPDGATGFMPRIFEIFFLVDDRASKPGPGPGRAFEARLKPGPGRASLKPGPGPGLLVNLPIYTISEENQKIMSAEQTQFF